MKKLVVVVVCLISFNGYSQHGLRLGSNHAAYSYEWLDNVDFSLGFYCGGVSRLKLGNRLSLRPELNYYQAGYKQKFENGSNTWTQKWTNHLLNLIGNLEFFITDEIAVVVGAGYNYKLFSTLREKGGDYSSSQTLNYNQENFKDRVFVSGNIGLGYTINELFLIDIRYDRSLVYDGEFYDKDLRQLITIGVGVLF